MFFLTDDYNERVRTQCGAGQESKNQTQTGSEEVRRVGGDFCFSNFQFAKWKCNSFAPVLKRFLHLIFCPVCIPVFSRELCRQHLATQLLEKRPGGEFKQLFQAGSGG